MRNRQPKPRGTFPSGRLRRQALKLPKHFLLIFLADAWPLVPDTNLKVGAGQGGVQGDCCSAR